MQINYHEKSEIFSMRSVKKKSHCDSHLTWVCLPNQCCYFFKSVCRLSFFLTSSLIIECQIMRDTSKFARRPFKSPLSVCTYRCFHEGLLLIYTTSLFSTIYLFINCSVYEDLTVIPLKSIWLHFRKLKMLFTSLGRSIFGKTVPSVYSLGKYPRNQAQFNMDLPAGE